MCSGSGWNISLVYPGVLLLGMFYAMLSVEVPLLSRCAFGSKEFSVIHSRVMSVNSLVTAAGAFLVGKLYSVSGNYSIVFFLAALAGVVCMISVFQILEKKDNIG